MESHAPLRAPRTSAVRSRIGLFALALLAVLPSATLRAQVAVVVNMANASEDLSIDRLKRLFLGQATTFSTGEHARLATHSGSIDRFVRAALGLQREIVRSRWMAMTFRGEATTLPAEYATSDDVKRFVREHPDAIAYLPAADVDATVKVLRIDGKRPSDPGYLIR
jgi:ABC-type phosphate transport system substrate-binding protein